MKAIRKYCKTSCRLLMAMLLFQSCVVYHKTPTSLQVASQHQIRTKIINSNGAISKYRYVTFEDGKFYGVSKKSGELIKTQLREPEITKVLTKNKSASTWITVGVIAVPVIAFIVVYVAGQSAINFVEDLENL